jgi:hypothetical protein
MLYTLARIAGPRRDPTKQAEEALMKVLDPKKFDIQMIADEIDKSLKRTGEKSRGRALQRGGAKNLTNFIAVLPE